MTATVTIRQQSYIDGTWSAGTGSEHIEVFNPATEELLAKVPLATVVEAEAAVEAAHRALAAWSATPPTVRAELLRRIAAEMRRRQDALTDLIVAEVGMPRSAAYHHQVGTAIEAFEDAAEFLPLALVEEEIGNAITIAEPVGVVVGITPWNFPLFQIALKAAPALAAGCTFVLKPSEVTPLNALLLAEILDAAGTPPGVFNVVVGRGHDVGAALVEHPHVDMVSLTGSTQAGRSVARAAAATLKKVALELGGKGPLVVLDDADLDAAVRYGVSKCFNNSGQTCAALTRLLVPFEHLDEAERIAANAVTGLKLGDPLDETTRLGPLVSRIQRERVLGFIRSGLEQGARLVAGGPETPKGLDRGWFVQPTIFSDVTEEMDIAREEIFGPVLSIIGYSNEADAIRVANNTAYGLAAGVHGTDPERIRKAAQQIRAGCVFLGSADPNMKAPFGGVKQSGYGRERGLHGILDYLVTKSLLGARTEPTPKDNE